MRSTITFDKDVAALLKREMARQKLSASKVVNEYLRRALPQTAAPARKRGKAGVPGTVAALEQALELGAGVD